jgi:hypothetical protein
MAPTARSVSLRAFREGAVALVPDLSCRLFGENDLDLTGIGQYSRNVRASIFVLLQAVSGTCRSLHAWQLGNPLVAGSSPARPIRFRR